MFKNTLLKNIEMDILRRAKIKTRLTRCPNKTIKEQNINETVIENTDKRTYLAWACSNTDCKKNVMKPQENRQM